MVKKNDTLTIVEHVKIHSKLPRWQDMKISESTLKRRINQLKNDRIIKMIAYGTWNVLVSDEQLKIYFGEYVKGVNQGDLDSPTIQPINNKRAHDIRVVVALPIIKNWDRRTEYLEKKGIKWEPIQRGHGQKIWLRNSVIHLFNEHLGIIFHKEKMADTHQRAHEAVIEEFNVIMQRLEDVMAGASFKICGHYDFFLTGEYERMNCEFAQTCRLHGIKLDFKLPNGSRFWQDNSGNPPRSNSEGNDPKMMDGLDRLLKENKIMEMIAQAVEWEQQTGQPLSLGGVARDVQETKNQIRILMDSQIKMQQSVAKMVETLSAPFQINDERKQGDKEIQSEMKRPSYFG